jgi:glutaredoxin
MEYENPASNGFTIYAKSGCSDCMKTKSLLKERNPVIIDCDEYLFDDRPRFKEFINKLANTEVKFFPMVFNDGIYVGGYNETKKLYNTLGHVLDEMFNSDVNF